MEADRCCSNTWRQVDAALILGGTGRIGIIRVIVVDLEAPEEERRQHAHTKKAQKNANNLHGAPVTPVNARRPVHAPAPPYPVANCVRERAREREGRREGWMKGRSQRERERGRMHDKVSVSCVGWMKHACHTFIACITGC